MANRRMSVSSWLNHNDDEGGKNKYFRMDFKDGKTFYKFWLHPAADIGEVWRSVIKYTDGKHIKLSRWNAGVFESDKVLNSLRFLEEDGSFEHPPEVDPILFLIQWVNQQVASGKMDFCDEILKWEPEDDDAAVIHAGGFTGMFKSQKLDDQQRGAMRKIGIRQDEAYLYDCKPQKETIFIAVDNEAPGDGAQVVTLKQGPSKAIFEAIQSLQDQYSKTPEKADISKYPRCIILKKDAAKTVKGKKGNLASYTATFTDDDLTDAIQEVFDSPVPDTSSMHKPTNGVSLRNNLEQAWCHELVPDWDEIFAPFMKAAKGTSAVEDPASFNYGKNKKIETEEDEEEDQDETESSEETSSKSSGSNKMDPKPEPESETDEVEESSLACDKCGGKLNEKDFEKDLTCPHCGAEYEKVGEGEYNLKPEKPKKEEIKASRRPRK